MGIAWSPIALLGLTSGTLYLSLAATIYFAGQRTRRDLLFVGHVAATGFASLYGAGLMYLMTDAASAYTFQFMNALLYLLALAFLLLFAGTFATPLSWPLRTRVGMFLIFTSTGLLMIAAIREPTLLTTGVYRATYAPWDGVASPLTRIFALIVYPAAYVYVLIVGLDAIRRAAAGTNARAQAKALTLAIGARCLGVAIGWPMLFSGGGPAIVITALILLTTATSASSLILAHGMLRSQLFDLDLKIKWTVSRGTVAAAFVGVFFVVSEGAQTLLSDQLGPFIGLFAAGGLVFAIAPLQRAADRFADRALPSVQDTAEYRTVRKREVYRAAIEGALEEGDVSDKERAMLARLADQLGLGPLDMHAIEREARAARAGAT